MLHKISVSPQENIVILRKIKVGVLRSDQCWAKFDPTGIKSPFGCLETKLKELPSAFKNAVIYDFSYVTPVVCGRVESLIQINWLVDQCLKGVSYPSCFFFFFKHIQILKRLRWESPPGTTAVCCTVVRLAFSEMETVLHVYVRIYVCVALITKGILCTCTCGCTEMTLFFMEQLKGSWKKKYDLNVQVNLKQRKTTNIYQEVTIIIYSRLTLLNVNHGVLQG